uniref:Putative conserved plasma membrane protein n=1 Tax=Ixodes ricinus TaxID=34613 RepID=A0A131XS70_IXORI
MSASVGLSPACRASSVPTLPAFFSLHFFLVFLFWTLSVCCMHLFWPSHKTLACLNLPNFQHLCVRFSAFAANFECAGVCSCPWQYCYFAAFSCFLFCRCIYILPGCIASILFLPLTNNSNLFCKMLEA